ncbi:hypothetical protein BST27_09955 [Mycobacterium intermedium]|uniref:Phosphatidylethanolamine-binding protein n=1 Tax=Mycobacterium intermedium TaxID=28445 RepID=A0A1E3SDS1_MYCIE|nr:YbhB/YbcL family Raf kinase inhibitor-like protein [Mycobacterium intermedium]MCV6966831.1 YbhB/YbcL family Raf kinase inhibitor-like protein [Mycobacterium intermedium]ODQ99717.1 hypothetical protein BHQ20_16385 [Mycobacterium intermedium]OPE48599.1 hypothetical protein BV508_17455 [Mycobacterium intermedium]ORB07225.1 hypothetical protein BST27_09955 [Mycobacterium intermedium]
MRLAAAIVALLCYALTACGSADQATESAAPSTSAHATTTGPSSSVAPGFAVHSPAFNDNGQIPADYTCTGRNVPPALRWHNVPADTQSLALVLDDPDAVGGLYVHWVVTGIPPTASEIADGVLPAGAVVSANSGGKTAYLGPCPPAGSGVHHYRFQLYALSKPLTLAPTTAAAEATREIADSAITSAVVVGLFGG